MAGSYEDYEREYDAYLSRIRSFLAGTRNRSTLSECERLLQEAKKCATAMRAEAEVSGDAMRVNEAKQHLERDIAPLAREVQRQLTEMTSTEELFYQAPDIERGGASSADMESLILSSEDLLRESQSVLAETEQIGSNTLQQMGRQREQLQNTNSSLEAVQHAAGRAHVILMSMSRRACRSRLALYVMITVLSAANLWVLYAIYKKHHPTAADEDDGGDGLAADDDGVDWVA